MKGKTGLQMAVALGLVATSNMLTSCQRDFDFYDPDYVKQQYAQSWENTFGEIDSQQDWSMAKKATVNYTVYLDGLETYKLQLFTSNPIADANTTILANYEVTTDAKGYASKSFDVDVLKTDSTLYACCEDKYGNRSVKAVGVGNGNIDITFGAAPSTAQRSIALTRADEETPYYELYKDGVSYESVYNTAMQYADQAEEVTEQNYTQNWDGSSDYHKVLKISAGTTWEKPLNILGGGRILYVYGTYKVTSSTTSGGHGKIIVCDGGKLISDDESVSLTVTGDETHLVVLNDGEVDFKGSITFANGTGDYFGYVAPKATFKVGSLNNNGGLFYNYGTMEASSIKGGAKGSTYVNNGEMKITGYSGDGNSSTRLYNYCKFYAKYDLQCRNLIMGPSSYLEVGKNFYVSESYDGDVDPAEIRLANASYVKILGDLSINNVNVIGPTESDEKAIFEINSVSFSNYSSGYENGGNYVSKGAIMNNIDFIVNGDQTSYFPDKLIRDMLNGAMASWGKDNTIYPVGTGGVSLVSGTSYSIPSSDCTKGFEGNTTTSETTNVYNPQTLIFACEDLGGTDDYDFNDVVFSVSHVSGETTATVKALAAGGTYPATIYYKSSETDSVLIGEIHARLNPSSSTSVMLNTNENTSLNTYTDNGVQITVPEGWTISDNRDKFIISINTGAAMNGVYINQTISSEMEAGKAPQVIVLPNDWQWPIERVKMTEAYPDFGNWSANSDDYKWIENKVSSKLIAR
jgi:hypothetical protein